MKTLEERFWAKVQKSDGCWTWTAYRTDAGYGQISDNGRLRYAHRLSWECANGPIPEGMFIDHTCYDRGCVNPGHMRLVTNKQNMENRSGLDASNTSGVRGVSWEPSRGKFIARVRHNRRLVYVGRFTDLASADAAVTAKRNELFTHNDHDKVAAL